jgi:hypothetical protein
MKQVLAVIAVVSLVFNAYLVYDLYFQGGKGSGWHTNPEENGEVPLSDLTVTVPSGKLGDMATYDYKIYAEIYWKDYQTGNWSDMRLDVTGNLFQWFHSNVVERPDGFWQKHSTVAYEADIQASFAVYVAGSDSEPLTIPGSLNDKRIEYRDLTKKIAIDSYMNGDVTIDRLPRINKALTYKGEVEYYADPNRKVSPSLDEQIFGDGKTIKLDENGTVAEEHYYSLYNFTLNTYYNWSADRAALFKGFKTLHINITSHTQDLMDYNEQTWISSDSPFPIKRFQRTNQSYSDENGTFWYAVELTNTLQDKGFNPGTIDIPWGTCKGDHWTSRNPDGEYKQYKYVPVAGNGYSASSFDFKTEDVDNFARENSPGLQNYLAQYNGVTMTSAAYNASRNPLDVNGKAGSYRWNLTYGYFPTDDEWREAQKTHNYNFSYNVVVIKNVTKDLTKPLQSQYIETVEIENDWGRVRNYAALPRDALPSDGLTLAASEDIMMKQPMVKQNVADKNGEIDWGDFETTYGVALTGVSDQTSPGMQIVELLTGITMPTADYAWMVQKGTVYQSGSTFTAAVDVESGQMVYAMSVEGTALMGLFG